MFPVPLTFSMSPTLFVKSMLQPQYSVVYEEGRSRGVQLVEAIRELPITDFVIPGFRRACPRVLELQVRQGENVFVGLSLSSPVEEVRGVGATIARRLRSLGIRTVEDLLYHCPRYLQDRTAVQPIASLRTGKEALIRATVHSLSSRRTRSGKDVVEASLKDDSGRTRAVWFNQAYLRTSLKLRQEYLFWGGVRHYNGLCLVNPSFDLSDSERFTGLIPIYPQAKGLASRSLRRLIASAFSELDTVEQIVPKPVLQKRKLLERATALRWLHFPDTKARFQKARETLAHEEFFVMQSALALLSHSRRKKKGHRIVVTKRIEERIRARLPFQFTPAQERVVSEIREDLASPYPMNRLLQGDVGSGKTVVAIYAVLAGIACRYQCAIMAPTEILAEQHYLKVSSYLVGSRVRIEFLRGGMPSKDKAEALRKISSGEAHLVIGTHAVIQSEVEFHKLGVVVIDEQHKFGVLQRAELSWKSYNPDVLVMTATPIPRTLAMTVFSDLELSVLDELPGGGRNVVTKWLPSDRKAQAYEIMRRILETGKQGFILCPLIEESEKLDLTPATKLYEEVKELLAPHSVALLHGRMKLEQKQEVMRGFRKGEHRVLVSTSVVEVGIDVPNATVLIVENCERFGLSQLHQMRGRIGRAGDEALCILLGDCKTEESRRRVRAMLRTNDGFEIAKEDFLLRGPGELLGTRQHGLPELRIADIFKDEALLRMARRDAFSVIDSDPSLSSVELRPLRETLLIRYAERLPLGSIG